MSKKRKTRKQKQQKKHYDFSHVEKSVLEEKEKKELTRKMYEVEEIETPKGEVKKVEKSFLRPDLIKILATSSIFFVVVFGLYIFDSKYHFLINWSDSLMNWLLGK